MLRERNGCTENRNRKRKCWKQVKVARGQEQDGQSSECNASERANNQKEIWLIPLKKRTKTGFARSVRTVRLYETWWRRAISSADLETRADRLAASVRPSRSENENERPNNAGQERVQHSNQSAINNPSVRLAEQTNVSTSLKLYQICRSDRPVRSPKACVHCVIVVLSFVVVATCRLVAVIVASYWSWNEMLAVCLFVSVCLCVCVWLIGQNNGLVSLWKKNTFCCNQKSSSTHRQHWKRIVYKINYLLFYQERGKTKVVTERIMMN